MIKGYDQELNLVKSIQLINNFGAKIRWLFDQNIKPLKFLQNELFYLVTVEYFPIDSLSNL